MNSAAVANYDVKKRINTNDFVTQGKKRQCYGKNEIHEPVLPLSQSFPHSLDILVWSSLTIPSILQSSSKRKWLQNSFVVSDFTVVVEREEN